MALRQLRMIDDGKAGVSDGLIVIFRPNASLDRSLLNMEAEVYAHDIAERHGVELLDDQPYDRLPVDDLKMRTTEHELIGSHPTMWAEIWRTAVREP